MRALKYKEQSIKIEEQERQQQEAKNHIVELSEEAKKVHLGNQHVNLKLQHRADLDELV